MNKFETVQKLCFFKVNFYQTPTSIDQYSRNEFNQIINSYFICQYQYWL